MTLRDTKQYKTVYGWFYPYPDIIDETEMVEAILQAIIDVRGISEVRDVLDRFEDEDFINRFCD